MSTEEIPELSLSEVNEESRELCSPTSNVVWKTEATFVPRQLPVIKDGQGEAVALLKDWRERFKPPYQYPVGSTKVKGDRVSNMARKDSNKVTGETHKQSTQGKIKVASDSVRSRKRPAESNESTASQPRKRTLTSRAAVSAELHIPSNGTATPTRKR